MLLWMFLLLVEPQSDEEKKRDVNFEQSCIICD